MTHRSRSGGPTKKHAQKNKDGRKLKLNHPPPRPPTETETTSSAALPPAPEEEDDDEDAVPPPTTLLELTDAHLLAVLRTALRQTVHAPDFLDQVQTVKGLLFERKWLELFTDPRLLDAYAGRWVPSRALCFRELLAGVRDVRRMLAAAGGSRGEDGAEADGSDGEEAENGEEGEETGKNGHDGATPKPLRVLSLGGGAGSELLAFAALAHASRARIHWHGVDIGAWGGVLDKIEAAARDVWALDGSEFSFAEMDLLPPPPQADKQEDAETQKEKPLAPAANGDTAPAALAPPPAPALESIFSPAPDITTLFFTLTELLSQSRARTVHLLRQLTLRTTPGSLLVVADSASDIAQFPLGAGGRTWPVYMVLDAIMGALSKDAQKAGDAEGWGGWECVRKEDSKWFRLKEDALWPCKLENARYWLRVYRRV